MSGFVVPKGYSPSIVPKYTPEQNNFISSLLQQMQGGSASALQHLSAMAAGSPETFAGQEAQAMNFFKNKLAPNIRQQYAHQGMLGSSAFQGALSQAGSDLSQSLYNQRQDLQAQAIRDLLGLSTQLGTHQTYDFGLAQKPQKDRLNWGSLVSLLGKFFEK